jgi:membrane fusion protein (multidrug efflux system)
MRSIVPLLLAVSACARADAGLAPKPTAPPIHVPLVAVAEAPTPDVLALTGELAADQRSEVTAETQGRVIAVLAQLGQRVKRGEAIVELDIRTAALSAREAHATLDAVRSEQQLAERECARSATLLASGAITQSEADREAARCRTALSQVAAADARATLVAKGIADGIVRAPFDGVVAARAVALGEWVAPGRPLFTIVDRGPLKVELAVPEASVPAIHLGQPVELRAVARPTSYAATVTRLGAEIGRSRALIVEATVEPTPDLMPGMFVSARVVIGQTRRPAVPQTAVVKRGKTWHAFVAANGVLEDRIVKLGPRPDAERVSIVRGLTPTDRVVQVVTDQIVDGLRVE